MHNIQIDKRHKVPIDAVFHWFLSTTSAAQSVKKRSVAGIRTTAQTKTTTEVGHKGKWWIWNFETGCAFRFWNWMMQWHIGDRIPGQACSCGQGACDFLGAILESSADFSGFASEVWCFLLFAGFRLVEVAILMAGATLEASLEWGKTLEDMETCLQSNTSCHVRHVMYPSFDEIWPFKPVQ